jgi:hypothetical protein
MAAISDADVSIDASGNIRWEGAATTNRHTVLEFIQWLMDKQDDEQAAGDDLLDITVDTPFNRSTDQILTLNSPFNIDDTFASHLYNGSVSQTEPTLGGETLWSGLNVIGPVEAGTEYMIIQNGKVLPAIWGTGINPESAPSLVFSRHLVKSKYAGSEIDGQKITVLARELGDQFRRFPVTLGTGNSVAAIGNGVDIFNTTADATLAGYTTIGNTEGFQQIDIDGNGIADGDNEYYSQWTKGTQTVNDTYEYTKWISQRAHEADATSGAVSGTDYTVDNATILGQAQSFVPLSDVTEKLVEARWQIKIGLGAPTGPLYCELYDSDDASPGVPTGAVLARSENVLGTAITSTYEEVIFRFNLFDPSDGTDQSAGLDLANTEYYIALRHPTGDASNYFEVEGSATSVDATQDRAEDTGSWTGSGTTDLNLIVKSCPAIHGIPGELMQGINIEVGYDGEAGTGLAENNIVMWGTHLWYDNLAGGPFFPGEEVTFTDTGTLVSGGHVLYDDGVNELIVVLDSPGAAVIGDNDQIVGLISGATADLDTGTGGGSPIEDEDLSGGTGIVLAEDDNTGTGEIYLQVMTGVSPVNNNRIRRDDVSGDPLADYVDATTTLNPRTLNPEFVGVSTGSNIIGAYGIGFNKDDVGSSDLFKDLSDASRTPPNNVLFSVTGLIAGEDRVLVGPRTGTALDRGQWLVATALTVNAETLLVVKTGTDTVPFPDAEENWPSTGIGADVSRLRIERDDGIYKRIPYDSHDGTDTFTLGTPATSGILMSVNSGAGTITRAAGSYLTDGFENGCRFTGANFPSGGNNATFTAATVTDTVITVVDSTGMVTESGDGDETCTSNGWDFSTGTAGMDNAAVNNDAFLAFIDLLADAATESFTGVHGGTNRNLFVRVRDGGGTPIKTFEATSAQFLATPQTVAAVRTPDA